MKIVVSFKVLPNPDRVLEEDWEAFSPSNDLAYAGLEFSCFDSSALELGLRIKEQAAVQGAEATCTALTVCESVPANLLSSLYAIGFDEVLCLPQPQREFRPAQIAALLAEEIRRQKADLVLTGTQAGMAETGMVPYLLAQELGWPLASGAEDAQLQNGLLAAQCRREEGLVEQVLCLPAVCSVDNSPIVLRCATLRARMAAMSRSVTLLDAEKTLEDIPAPQLARPRGGRSCEMLDPEDKNLLPHLLALLQAEESAQSEEQAEIPSEWSELLQERAVMVHPKSAHGADAPALEELLADGRKELVLLPDDLSGRTLAAHLAQGKDWNCFFHAQVQELDPKQVTVKKRVFGANLEWTVPLALPAVLTLDAAEQKRFAAAPVVQLEENLPLPTWLKEERLLLAAEPSALQTANVVVACGGGMGSKDACERARELAQLLGAGFGLTRPSALNAWGKTTEIVGQSGSSIAPRCCLVLGAAGAAAFQVGIDKADRIIAVNTDPHALIFKNADFGLQMDAKTLVERLIEVIQSKEEMSGNSQM